jgi:hypothetical protein
VFSIGSIYGVANIPKMSFGNQSFVPEWWNSMEILGPMYLTVMELNRISTGISKEFECYVNLIFVPNPIILLEILSFYNTIEMK